MRGIDLASCALALSISTLSAAAPAEVLARRTFTILQINDLYKIEGLEAGRFGGLARVRTLRRELEAGGGSVLVLHAGDFLFPSVMSKYFKGRPMIDALNLLDGDAGAFDPRLVVVPGNHEFDDPDPGVLLGRMAESDFRWVDSNLRYCRARHSCGERFSARLRNVEDTIVVEVSGVRVGIFGLTANLNDPGYVAYDDDPAERRSLIAAALEDLKSKGAEVRIALTHETLREDLDLAAAYPEIDLIVGGHEHEFSQRRVGRTWITKADADARSVVVCDVTVSPSGEVDAAPRQVTLGEDVVPDTAVGAVVERWQAELARTIDKPFEVVAMTESRLEGEERAVRSRETALGNFLADVMRDRSHADVALLNGGAIRIDDDIVPGPIRRIDLEGVFYFDDAIVSFELTGAELLDLLRISASGVGASNSGFLQVGGIRFGYRIEGAEESRAVRVDPAAVEIKLRNTDVFVPLDLSRRYVVSTLDYFWANGHRDGYPLFSQGRQGGSSPKRLDTGARIGWRKATEDAIAALPGRRVTARIDGRIERLGGGAAP
jgi:5'-nucleotidase